MISRFALSLAVLSSPILAQARSELSNAVAPQRTSVTRNVGLQPFENGLLGGGADYQVRFDANGMLFEPALGRAVATTQQLRMRPLAVERGGEPLLGSLSPRPKQSATRVVYEHAPAIRERFDVGVDNVAVSWEFAERPLGSGDLVVRYALATTLPAPTTVPQGGLQFEIPSIGGVTIGGVTGVDANGVTIAGTLSYEAGELRMSLPAAFVDRAALPFVLDPLVGTKFAVQAAVNYDEDGDAAYDASTDTYLVVWRRIFSAASAVPRGQRVSSAGQLVGATMFFAASGDCDRPRVANLPSRQRFGMVYVRNSNSSSVRFEAISAATGSSTHSATLASGPIGALRHVDIGGDSAAPVGSDRGFTVVYDADHQDEILANQLHFDSQDQLVAAPDVVVFSDTSGSFALNYSEPSLSRTTGPNARHMVVARRFGNFGPSRSIVAAMITSNTATVGPTATLASSQNVIVSVPDVDGYGDKWVAAWQSATSLTANPAVVRRPIRVDAAGSALTLGPSTTLGGSASNQVSTPSVGYTPGRTWLGYRFRGGSVIIATSLRASAVDSETGTWCGDTFSEIIPIASTDHRLVVATPVSGGRTSGEDALAVFSESGDVYAQILRNYGTGGSYTNLGGGCGNGGLQAFSHEPGIGSSGLICSINGLPNTALVTVFNLSAPGATLPCGSCVWTPFSITLSEPVANGSAHVEFPIPCLPALISSQFETQWTTIDLLQVPCPLFPGLVLSDRSLMQIGN